MQQKCEARMQTKTNGKIKNKQYKISALKSNNMQLVFRQTDNHAEINIKSSNAVLSVIE